MSIKSITAAITGTAGAQAIGFVFMPILTQIYSPEMFGYVGFILAVSAILLPISTLSFPVAIVLAKNDADAKQLSGLSMMLAFVVSLLSFLLIWLGTDWVLDTDWIVASFSDKSVSQYLCYVPLSVFFCACLEIADNWSIRKAAFALRAKVAVGNSLFINGSKLLLGLLWPTPLTLMLVTVTNPLINAVLLIKGDLLKRNKSGGLNGFFYGLSTDWRKLVSTYQAFPVFQAPQVFMNAISKGGPILVLGSFFGPSVAGFYGLSYTILMVPGTLVSKAIGDVFYSQIAKIDNQGFNQELSRHWVNYTGLLACIGIIPLLIIILWGPSLFTLVFGKLWLQAGIYAQWLSLWIFFIFTNSPSLKAIIVLKKQKFAMGINMITMPLRLLALLAGAYLFQSEKVALLGFVFVSVLHNILIMLLAYRACNKTCSNIKQA